MNKGLKRCIKEDCHCLFGAVNLYWVLFQRFPTHYSNCTQLIHMHALLIPFSCDSWGEKKKNRFLLSLSFLFFFFFPSLGGKGEKYFKQF